jgi:hypothetical protein
MVPAVSVAAVHERLTCVLEAAVATRFVGAVGVVTVKARLLLARPPTVTTTLPVVAPLGTGAAMLVGDQNVGAAALPPNVNVLVPCVAPKFAPAIETSVPPGPEVGETLVVLGTAVKVTPLLACPPTLTTTGPVAAALGSGTTMLVELQLVGVAVAVPPPKNTALVPCVAPKFVPVIVINVPAVPDAGERVVIVGITVNGTPLLGCPPVTTVTLPVVVPLGTGTTMLVALQLVGVAVVPLKNTLLVPCVAPKFIPVIVTDVPTEPEVGERPVIVASGVMVIVDVAIFDGSATEVAVTVTVGGFGTDDGAL